MLLSQLEESPRSKNFEYNNTKYNQYNNTNTTIQGRITEYSHKKHEKMIFKTVTMAIDAVNELKEKQWPTLLDSHAKAPELQGFWGGNSGILTSKRANAHHSSSEGKDIHHGDVVEKAADGGTGMTNRRHGSHNQQKKGRHTKAPSSPVVRKGGKVPNAQDEEIRDDDDDDDDDEERYIIVEKGKNGTRKGKPRDSMTQ